MPTTDEKIKSALNVSAAFALLCCCALIQAAIHEIGEKLSAGTKSMTFSVEFRSPEKTLTDEDVAEACAKIVSVMEKRHGAALRR